MQISIYGRHSIPTIIFSNTDIEITTCQLEHDHLWFLKTGSAGLGPSALHAECKKNGALKSPSLKGRHRNVVKLTRRDLGNVVNETLIIYAVSTCQKEQEN